jgi:hypothetical protein
MLMLASLGLASLAPETDPPHDEPWHKAVVTCFLGKVDSGSYCSGPQYQADGKL